MFLNIFDNTIIAIMKNNESVLYKNSTFFSLCLIWFVGLSAVVLLTTKKESFLFINQANHPFFDRFFRLLTFMGDGIFIIALAVLLFLLKYKRLALALFSSYILSGLIAQVIKRLMKLPRPAGYFDDPSVIHSGLSNSLSKFNSFPSGHTTSVFAAAVIISLYTGKKSLAVIVFIFACVAAYSRVYLGQHFVEDILAGSFLGVTVGMLCYMAQEKLLAKSYAIHNWGKL